MKQLVALVMVVALISPAAMGQRREAERLEECGTVLNEILDIPEGIPQELLDKAECVVIFPSTKKGAIGIGGSYGRGAMVCRTGDNFTGPWGAPSMFALEGINIGIQLGGQATDFVLLVMNPRGASAILKSKTKLGADASAAAGPKGRTATAATDATLRAEVLTYSRSRGLFAGVSLEGSSLRADNGANRSLYGGRIDARHIVLENRVGVPAAARTLVDTLNQRSPKNHSDPRSLNQ